DEAPTWLHYAGPLREDCRPIREMVQRIDADQPIERTVLEGEALTPIGEQEFSTVQQSRFGSRCARCRYRLRMDIHAMHAAAGDASNARCGTPGAACHVEHRLTGTDAEPADEPIVLVRRQPPVLSDVLAERFRPDGRVQLGSEPSVLRVVVPNGGHHAVREID